MKKIIFSIFPVLLLTFVFLSISHADNYVTDFESFSLSSVNGQNGWTSNWSNQAVETQPTFPTFGGQTFRVSNGGNVNNSYIYAKPLLNPAGEAVANNGSFPSGLRQPHFEAEWDFASAVGNVYQPNLRIDAVMSRGDNPATDYNSFSYNLNGMSLIALSDTPTGLKVEVQGYDATLNGGDVATKIAASGLDRLVPHHIKVAMDFVDGSGNDLVQVCVDKDQNMCVIMPSMEGLYPVYGVSPITVRTVAFMPLSSNSDGSTRGFYIDNFTMTSSGNEPTPTIVPTGTPVPTAEPSVAPSPTAEPVKPPKNVKDCKKYGWKKFNNPVFVNQGQCIKYVLKSKWKELKNQREEEWNDLVRKFDDED